MSIWLSSAALLSLCLNLEAGGSITTLSARAAHLDKIEPERGSVDDGIGLVHVDLAELGPGGLLAKAEGCVAQEEESSDSSESSSGSAGKSSWMLYFSFRFLKKSLHCLQNLLFSLSVSFLFLRFLISTS